mmetsp:Transcript_144062/g.461156  ORF Transcript_144062/g.461156 Transcript_144062/m.461156 type:complete len:471 (-) Transcript_144062:290-1702(-)
MVGQVPENLNGALVVIGRPSLRSLVVRHCCRCHMEERHLVGEDCKLDGFLQGMPPRVLHKGRQRPLDGLQVWGLTCPLAVLVQRDKNLVQKLGHLGHTQAVFDDLHVERLPEKGQRLRMAACRLPQVAASPSLHAEEGRALADATVEELVGLRVVHVGLVVLASGQKALAQVAQHLGPQNELVRLNNFLLVQGLREHFPRLVEFRPPLALEGSVGNEDAQVPQIHPVHPWLVVPRRFDHFHEIHRGLVLSPHPPKAAAHVPVQRLVKCRRALLVQGEIGQSLDLVHHFHGFDIPALLHPDLRDVVQVLDHPCAAPLLGVPGAAKQNGLRLFKLVVLLIGAGQVDGIPEDLTVGQAFPRVPQHADQLHLKAFDGVLISGLALLKGSVAPTSLHQRRSVPLVVLQLVHGLHHPIVGLLRRLSFQLRDQGPQLAHLTGQLVVLGVLLHRCGRRRRQDRGIRALAAVDHRRAKR